jgi:O-antigen/teichoic acid export membrane protein
MLYYIYKISKQYGWAKPDFAWIKTIIAYGLPLVLGAYAMWGLNTLNRIFLVKYCTLSDVGIFSVAFSLGHMFIQVIINPLWTMYPNSAASLYNIGHHEKLQQLFNSTAGLMVFLSFPAIALLTVLGKPFITVFASTSFSGAGPLISIITAAYVFHILASFYSISLGFVNKQFMDTIAICIACVINVVLNILLIPRYGIIGAAGATCLGFLVQLVVVFISAKLVTQLYTNFRFISKVFTISLVMGFSIYFIRERVAMGNISQLIILSLSGVIIYFLLALSMGLVRTEEIKRMFYKTSN